jgi:hypothetical protein
MKKTLLLVLFSVILLTGCGGAKTPNPEDVKKMTLNQERRIGVLQSLGGAFTSSQATHLLRMDDGKTLALKSSTVELKSEKYSGKEVEVMGEILRTTDGNQVMTVESIDIIDTEGLVDNQIPQWVDYNSDNLKISFKYRDDYQVEENERIIITKKPSEEKTEGTEETSPEKAGMTPKTVTEIQMEKVSEDQEGLLSAMGVKSLESSDVLAEGYNRSKITQKAIEAYKKSENSGKYIIYFFQIGNSGYKVSFKAVEEDANLLEEQNMFYDILASIDFQGGTTADSAKADENADSGTSNDSASDLTGSLSSDATSSDLETDTSTPETDEQIETVPSDNNISGFETFKSDSQNFTIQYPKSYYFGSISPSSSNAIRSYQFGSQPLEESPGEITLDVLKGTLPEGKSTEYGGLSMIKTGDTSGISLYFEKSGKIYRLSGEQADEGLLKQMASTLQ